MHRFIISPPFGYLISHPKCTRVIGTYTLDFRGGWFKKIYRGILTTRPIPGGWINNIGLQNPGIKSIKRFNPNLIYSISALKLEDWDELIQYIPEDVTVELNLSCPNVHHLVSITDMQVGRYIKKFPRVIFKLSPTTNIYNETDRLVSLGAKFLHIANAIPTPSGGESGTNLKSLSLEAIKIIKTKHPDISIIGGGGIYSPKDLQLYKTAGASYFSLATVWFQPWKAIKILNSDTIS